MLTALEAQPANTAAVSPADRMHAPALRPPGRPEPPRRPVAARERTPRPAKSWLGRAVLIAGLAMIPWVFILACSLPPATRAAHWSTAWAGLDGLEAVGLITTGVALIGRYGWLCLPAAVTSTLLVIDAWFDVTTSAPGPAVTAAVAMAVLPELPMAGLCAVLAIRHAPDGTLCQRHVHLVPGCRETAVDEPRGDCSPTSSGKWADKGLPEMGETAQACSADWRLAARRNGYYAHLRDRPASAS